MWNHDVLDCPGGVTEAAEKNVWFYSCFIAAGEIFQAAAERERERDRWLIFMCVED